MPAACAALLAVAASAAAHPLGNFTVNHLARVAISDDAVDVRYVLDLAEIPSFQERRLTREQSLAAKTAAAVQGLRLDVDGRRVALRVTRPGRLETPPGQGGLTTTRFEVDLRAAGAAPRRVRLRDATYGGRSDGARSSSGPAAAPPFARRRRSPATRPTASAATRGPGRRRLLGQPVGRCPPCVRARVDDAAVAADVWLQERDVVAGGSGSSNVRTRLTDADGRVITRVDDEHRDPQRQAVPGVCLGKALRHLLG